VHVLRDVFQPPNNFSGQAALGIVGPFHSELIECTENKRENDGVVGEEVEEGWRRCASAQNQRSLDSGNLFVDPLMAIESLPFHTSLETNRSNLCLRTATSALSFKVEDLGHMKTSCDPSEIL
jgi:hypothetical protein